MESPTYKLNLKENPNNCCSFWNITSVPHSTAHAVLGQTDISNISALDLPLLQSGSWKLDGNILPTLVQENEIHASRNH